MWRSCNDIYFNSMLINVNRKINFTLIEIAHIHKSNSHYRSHKRIYTKKGSWHRWSWWNVISSGQVDRFSWISQFSTSIRVKETIVWLFLFQSLYKFVTNPSGNTSVILKNIQVNECKCQSRRLMPYISL